MCLRSCGFFFHLVSTSTFDSYVGFFVKANASIAVHFDLDLRFLFASSISGPSRGIHSHCSQIHTAFHFGRLTACCGTIAETTLAAAKTAAAAAEWIEVCQWKFWQSTSLLDVDFEQLHPMPFQRCTTTTTEAIMNPVCAMLPIWYFPRMHHPNCCSHYNSAACVHCVQRGLLIEQCIGNRLAD